MCSWMAPSVVAGASDSRHLPGQQIGEPVGVAGGPYRDDGVGAHALLEFSGRSEREDPAVVHDRDPVTQAVRLLHVVRGQQDGLPGPVELAEHVPQRQPTLRVKAGGGLVEEEHRRAVEDRAGHHQPLGHAAGQGVHRGLGPLGQLEPVEQFVGQAAGLARADAEQAAVEIEVLPHGELPVERVLLRHDPAQLLCQRRVGRHIDAADESASRRRHDAGGQHPGSGRLACAVGPEESEDLTGPHLEVQPVDGREVRAGIDLRQILRGDRR